jgi:hypothetical protein
MYTSEVKVKCNSKLGESKLKYVTLLDLMIVISYPASQLQSTTWTLMNI